MDVAFSLGRGGNKMLELAIGAVTTLLGVGVGCIVLELAMRALKHSLGSYDSGEHAGSLQSQPSLVAWDGEQVAARIPTFSSANQLVRARKSVRL